MSAAALQQRHLRAPHNDPARVTGVLMVDGRLDMTLGSPPHQLLTLLIKPERGLPYFAQLDLGTDRGDQLAAEALLPHMRQGAVASVACQGLELRNDHGHAALRLVNPHSVILFADPARPPAAPQPDAAAPQQEISTC